MDVNRRADVIPVENPQSVGVGSVDTTVAHRMAEVMMPVSTVDRIVAAPPTDPLHTRQIVTRTTHFGDGNF